MNPPNRLLTRLRRLWAALPDVNAWALPTGPDPVPRLSRYQPPLEAARPALRIDAAVRQRRRVFLHGKVINLETK